MVTTKKIAARVRGEETDCETAATGADIWAWIGSDTIGIQPVRAGRKPLFEKARLPRV